MDNSLETRSSNSNVEITVESTDGDGGSADSPVPVSWSYWREVSVEDRKTYLKLYGAAMDGNWKAAKRILDRNRNLVGADLTNRRENILHVSTQANQADFVRLLLEYLNGLLNENEIRCYLELRDVNKNTAFIFAVASGNMKIVRIMGEKNPTLRTLKGFNREFTPLHIAALQGRSEMARHLYQETISEFDYGDDGLKLLLFLCVNAGIYDLALELVKDRPDAAFARDEKNETVLHILSRKPLGLKDPKYKLIRFLWNDICLGQPDRKIMETISQPSHVVFNAVEVGNFKFLEMLVTTYPYLLWEVDKRGRSILHIAVLNRRADIYSFTRDIGSIKDLLVNFRDFSDGSTLLAMAAKLPSKDRLNLVSEAAFQMTLEILWFEEVKKIAPPSFMEMKQNDDKTPDEIFTQEHANLVREAQTWTKETTNCCMLVSTLITTGVFTAAFSIPGGEDDIGSPHYLANQKTWFVIFSIFDAIAMISSSTAIFIFFSILISRHEERDFQYKSLPIRLVFGLITLLISIICMMVSFSSAFVMYFNTKTHSHGSHHNGLKWIPIFISVLAFIPIPIFLYMLWPLWSDIAKLTKVYWYLSRPRRTLHLKSM